MNEQSRLMLENVLRDIGAVQCIFQPQLAKKAPYPDQIESHEQIIVRYRSYYVCKLKNAAESPWIVIDNTPCECSATFYSDFDTDLHLMKHRRMLPSLIRFRMQPSPYDIFRAAKIFQAIKDLLLLEESETHWTDLPHSPDDTFFDRIDRAKNHILLHQPLPDQRPSVMLFSWILFSGDPRDFYARQYPAKIYDRAEAYFCGQYGYIPENILPDIIPAYYSIAPACTGYARTFDQACMAARYARTDGCTYHVLVGPAVYDPSRDPIAFDGNDDPAPSAPHLQYQDMLCQDRHKMYESHIMVF